MKHKWVCELLMEYRDTPRLTDEQVDDILEAVACLERDNEYIGELYKPIRLRDS